MNPSKKLEEAIEHTNKSAKPQSTYRRQAYKCDQCPELDTAVRSWLCNTECNGRASRRSVCKDPCCGVVEVPTPPLSVLCVTAAAMTPLERWETCFMDSKDVALT